MRTMIRLFLLLLGFAAPAAVPAQSAGFRVIVNPSSPLAELSSDEVTRIFLKKSAKFSDGTVAIPVDQAKGSAVRAAFSREVLGRTASAVDTYWQQQIFGGGELPPAVKASDAEVVAMVRATPGAIGYVSAAADVDGVKVIAVR